MGALKRKKTRKKCIKLANKPLENETVEILSNRCIDHVAHICSPNSKTLALIVRQLIALKTARNRRRIRNQQQ